MHLKLYPLIICLLFPFWAIGQHYNYTHYATKDGLAGETVYTMFQDHEGFLWIGTETGLSRFDGNQFKNFTVADGLPSNEVLGFFEDSYHRMWVRSFSNELCYIRDGRIYNKNNDAVLKKAMPGKNIQSIIQLRSGAIVITDDAISAIVIDTAGNVARYKRGVFRVHLEDMRDGWLSVSGLIMHVDTPLRKYMQQHLSVSNEDGVYIFFRQGDIFILSNTHTGITTTWDNRLKKMTNPAWHFRTITMYTIDKDNLLAAHPDGGAYIHNFATNTTEQLFPQSYIVNGMLRDRAGNTWFSTRGSGLFKLSAAKVLSYTPGNLAMPVHFIHFHNGRLYLGMGNAQLWELSESSEKNSRDIHFVAPKKLDRDMTWLKDNARQQYINYSGAEFLRFYHNNRHYTNRSIKTLYTFNDTLLSSQNKGVYIYRINDGEVLQYLYKQRATCAIRFGTDYYVGTLHGLLIIDRNGNIRSRLLPYRISYFAPDSNGVLWAGTYEAGVFALKNGKIYSAINSQNSTLSSNLCRCIYPNGNDLWIGTDKGLNKLVRTGTGYRLDAIYSSENGLNADIINTMVIKDSIVYVGTTAGLNIFKENTPLYHTPPDIKITSVVSADTLVTTAGNNPVILPHNNNFLKIDFAGISFSSGKISYRYRLLGLDDRWQNTSETSLSFISLPSGKYTLQVQAINDLGQKSSIAERKFEVKKAVTEYLWFRILAVLALIAIVVFIIQLRTRKIRRAEQERNSINKRIMELEQMALRAQMNPHFIFNCLNSVQNYILKQDVAGANFYLSQFAGLIRQTLEHASRLSVTLREEITYLSHYIELEKMQANVPFSFSIHTDPGADMMNLPVPNMIIQPLVENAIKHGLTAAGNDARLEIAFTRTNDMLICRIEDNGPGIQAVLAGKKTGIHTSKGLALTEERIKIYNLLKQGTAYISFNIIDLRHEGRRGTRAMIYIPVGHH